MRHTLFCLLLGFELCLPSEVIKTVGRSIDKKIFGRLFHRSVGRLIDKKALEQASLFKVKSVKLSPKDA